MIRRFVWSTAGLAAAAMVVLAVMLAKPASAMQEIAAKIREAKSYTCTMKTESTADAPWADTGRKERMEMYKLWWTEPGSVRSELHVDGRLVETSVHPAGKSGVRINHAQSTFISTPERNYKPGPQSPGHWLSQLAKSPGDTAYDLGVKEINGQPAHGYLLDSSAAIPESEPGMSIRVWADKKTKLPVLLEMASADLKFKGRMEDFKWDDSLDPKLFEAKAPEGYTDATPPPKTDDDKERDIADAFRFYAEVMGQYPKSTKFATVPADELCRKTGLSLRNVGAMTSEQIRSETYGKLVRSTSGWLWVFEIQRDNPDAAYHGKSVGPNDKNKVLLRWKKDAGYRVLFGDLHYETVTAEQLKKLETK